MAAPNDLNSSIALAKGWVWCQSYSVVMPEATTTATSLRSRGYWRNPEGKPRMRPAFVGTLEGVSGMMRDLNEHAKKDRQYWWWGQNTLRLVDAPRGTFICVRHGIYADATFLTPWFWSPDDRPGACVGEAWLNMKEAG